MQDSQPGPYGVLNREVPLYTYVGVHLKCVRTLKVLSLIRARPDFAVNILHSTYVCTQ